MTRKVTGRNRKKRASYLKALCEMEELVAFSTDSGTFDGYVEHNRVSESVRGGSPGSMAYFFKRNDGRRAQVPLKYFGYIGGRGNGEKFIIRMKGGYIPRWR